MVCILLPLYPRTLLTLISPFLCSFGGNVQATYRLTIHVANATLNNPHIATMAVSINITGMVDWDATTVASVQVRGLGGCALCCL